MSREGNTPTDRPLNQEKAAVSGLPNRATPFFNHECLLTEVATALLDPYVSVITITGPAGIGKTALAVEVAYRLTDKDAFEGGVVWLYCRNHRDSSDLLRAAESQLYGTKSGSLDGIPPAGGSVSERVTALLRSRRCLLVLDGLDEMPEDRDIVGFLGRITPPGKVLITSRAPLGLRGQERIFELEGLSQVESRKLIEALA
ncbi:MAG: NACHT domain-containing protein, partial [Blastocatellia bacterium]